MVLLVLLNPSRGHLGFPIYGESIRFEVKRAGVWRIEGSLQRHEVGLGFTTTLERDVSIRVPLSSVDHLSEAGIPLLTSNRCRLICKQARV